MFCALFGREKVRRDEKREMIRVGLGVFIPYPQYPPYPAIIEYGEMKCRGSTKGLELD